MAQDLVRANVADIELTAGGMKMKTVAEVYGFCELIGRAGMLPKGVTLEGAVVATLAGARLGLDPFQAVQGVAVVNGRPALWGDAMLAVVKGSGLLEDEQVEYLPSRKECAGVRYTAKRKGVRSPYIGTFSRTDAERAGLWGKPGPWAQYPERMLLNRARAFALRDGFADQRGQIAAHLVGEGELAVGESARAGKAGCDVAVRLAVHAPAGLGLGTVALLDALPFFHERDMALVALADKLEGGEYAGRAGADDQNICFHASTFTFSMPCFSNSAKYSSMRAFSSSASSWLICSALMSRRASSSARIS